MRWLVTGGVGFIGTNLVAHLTEMGDEVVVVDDMSRGGVERNAEYLERHYAVESHLIDVSRRDELWAWMSEQTAFDAVAHLAGQVSLLESIRDPMRDFAVNALGTLNVLEFVRQHSPDTAVIGMSSNKVYGDLSQVTIREERLRYVATDWPNGFDESLPVDFHGPYGCSKGAADQYLADYARTYGMRTASLRQSSVYGPHQHPRSDQGWVAHLLSEALLGREIQLNGIGKQVRDLLHARDLAHLFRLLPDTLEPHEVNRFNVGGGAGNDMSILELFQWMEERQGVEVRYSTGAERPSDQRVFISDNSRVSRKTGWRPNVRLDDGLGEVADGLQARVEA